MHTHTKLLVSPINLQEAKEALEGGADIIDVKNPKEGSLGANFPWIIREIKSLLPKNVELSATLGDLDFKPGTASLAAYGLVSIGVDYVKAGFFGVQEEQALEMAGKIKRAIEGSGSKLVIAGYAEYNDIGCVSPFLLPKIAADAGAHVVMIDTARKNGRSLLYHHDLDELKTFVDDSHTYGLKAALAGSLKMGDIGRLKEIAPDIIGVRGLVCSDGDRVAGKISSERVKTLKEFILS